MSISTSSSDFELCVFCDIQTLEPRVIRMSSYVLSIVSNPAYRENHCLVLPRRHVTRMSELTDEEKVDMLAEAGRLERAVASKYGASVLHKYDPLTPDGVVKQSHLHMHVVPRHASDEAFGAPASLAEFSPVSDQTINEILARTM